MFRKNLEPNCSYCKNGTALSDGNIVCKHFGLISPCNGCKKFVYDSLKRIPNRRPNLPEYEQGDFSID